MPDNKVHSLHIDRDTFPGIALVIYPASIALINHALEQIKAGADLSAVSVGGGKFIAMPRQDWQTLYTAWRREVDTKQMFEDAYRAMQDLTKGMPP